MFGLAAVLFALSLASTTARDDGQTPVISRNHPKLHLAGAQQIIDGAMAKAKEMKVAVNVAVVDDGGHLLAFARMDGARPASVYTSLTKATAAATLRQATGPAGGAQPDLLLSLSLQNAASAGGGRMTSLKGGVPIVVDGQVVGAVGVGGGTGEQDSEVARAGIAALDKVLEKERK